MKNTIWLRKLTALAAAFVLMMSFGAAGGEALPVESAAPPFGTPWINSNVIGNLPAKSPEAKDDFYLNTNYFTIANAQQTGFDQMTAPNSEIKDVVMEKLLSGEELGEDIAQLRILFELGSDTDRLTREGIDQVRPFLDRIAAVQSLSGLNDLLLADDFPFSPYISTYTVPGGLDKENIVLLAPALSMSDDPLTGIEFYGKTVTEAELMNMMGLSNAIYAVIAARDLGCSGEEVSARIVDWINMEVSYVHHCGTTSWFLTRDYGEYAKSYAFLTPEELYALCPDFPLENTIKKFGRDKSAAFAATGPEWLKALNDLWKEENLPALKELTAFKVLMECYPYLDQDNANAIRLIGGNEVLTGEANGYAVCNRATTLPALTSTLYVEYGLGRETVDRLRKMTEDLTATYCEMVRETEWLSESSRQKALDKLQNMRLNVLEPVDGYIDFSGLKLTPASEGGSLLDAYLAIKAYRNEKENEMLGQKSRADLVWRVLSPININAFYDATTNSINVLPGFVTSSVYRKDMTDMELLGSVGSVIAHEISHGFDFLGSQFDAQGLGEPILSEADQEAFLARVQQVVDYFDRVEVLPGVYCDGTNLKMENAADLSGLLAAAKLAGSNPDNDLDAFFRSYARLYAYAIPDYVMKMLNTIDTHGARYMRVNFPVQMCPEFVKTYGIQEGDSMYVSPENRIVIWGK